MNLDTFQTKSLANRIPKRFEFGVATASYQIEGAHDVDGRKPSIWDEFAKTPGKVVNNHNGDIACDHYNRWQDDLDLIQSLGVDAYRFSIAWPRIIPDGKGAINEAGLDFYDRLIDGLVERKMKVFPTLYHWDLPLALYRSGGWTNRETADAFAEYARIVVARLGDRIDALATFNEPWCSTYLGHLYGKHAPGEQSIDAAMASIHVTNLAHGLGVSAARSERADLPMGLVLNAVSLYAASNEEADIKARERAFEFNNGVFFGPVFDGSYGPEIENAYGEKLKVQEGDLAAINQPLDWWGFNYYFPTTVKDASASDPQFPSTIEVASTDSDFRTDIGWELKPEGLTDLLSEVYDRYPRLPPCYITENGACYNMGPDEQGEIDDTPRIDYLNSHIGELEKAIEKEIPIKGYFAWSLMDNFEWAEGYKMRFGLVHVDYETQERRIKKSGKWYRELVSNHKELRQG